MDDRDTPTSDTTAPDRSRLDAAVRRRRWTIAFAASVCGLSLGSRRSTTAWAAGAGGSVGIVVAGQLGALGCHSGQGFHLARPLGVEAATDFLMTRQATLA